MRSDHEWLRLLGRQRALLLSELDHYYACRAAGLAGDYDASTAAQALQLYRATIEVCPTHVLRAHLLITA